MNNEITTEDIKMAYGILNEKEHIIFDDDFQTIWSKNGLHPTRFKLKKPGLYMIDKFIGLGAKLENKEITEVFGIKVCLSDEVKEDKDSPKN